MPFSVPTSWTWMMFGWLSLPAARASLMNCSTKRGREAYFGDRTLSATTRAIDFWLALKTMPMPPSPSLSPTSYLVSRSFSSTSPVSLTSRYSTSPTRMRSPNDSGRSVTFFSLRWVPLREPPSTRVSSLPSRRISQCRRLDMVSRIWMSHSLDRPRTMRSLLSGYSWPADGPDWQTNFAMRVCRRARPETISVHPEATRGKTRRSRVRRPGVRSPRRRNANTTDVARRYDRRLREGRHDRDRDGREGALVPLQAEPGGPGGAQPAQRCDGSGLDPRLPRRPRRHRQRGLLVLRALAVA